MLVTSFIALKKVTTGCKILYQFSGAVMHAYDMILGLLSNCLVNSQCMIDVCIQFNKEILEFRLVNLKSYCMAYHPHNTLIQPCH